LIYGGGETVVAVGGFAGLPFCEEFLKDSERDEYTRGRGR